MVWKIWKNIPGFSRDSSIMSLSDQSQSVRFLVHQNLVNLNAECIFCNGMFSDDWKEEKWVQCILCKKCHTQYAGYNGGRCVCYVHK
jgi:hypothetical protein